MAVICRIPRRPSVSPTVTMYKWNVYECAGDAITYKLLKAYKIVTEYNTPGTTEIISSAEYGFFDEETLSDRVTGDGAFSTTKVYWLTKNEYLEAGGTVPDGLITFELDGYCGYYEINGTIISDYFSEGGIPSPSNLEVGDVLHFDTVSDLVYIFDKIKRGNTFVSTITSEFPDAYPVDNYLFDKEKDKYYWFVRAE